MLRKGNGRNPRVDGRARRADDRFGGRRCPLNESSSTKRKCRLSLNRSLRTEVSVAGKRNFQGRDKEAETALEIQGRRCSLGNSANSGLIAGFREPSTQSLSNRSLASDPPRQFCDQMSLSDKTLCRKDWHSGAIGAVLSVNFGRQGRPDPAPPARSPRWGFGGAARRRETERRISMSKSAKKRPMASAPAAVPTTKSLRHSAGDAEPKRADRGSKQSRGD